MNEDAPSGIRPFTQAGTILMACALTELTQCREQNRVPAYEDKQEKRIKPVSAGPYVCLGCWRKGWRAEGPYPDDTWRIYNCDTNEEAKPWRQS